MMEDRIEPGYAGACITFGPLVEAELVARVNRFRVRIRLEDHETAAYLANPGRLEELMTPGRRVWVRPAHNPLRKTPYDLTLTKYAGTLVSMNSHLPNRLLQTALNQGALPWFAQYDTVRTEVPFGESRLDFQLSHNRDHVCWLEAKSVTLVSSGAAMFPDAPTDRGRRHLRELIKAVRQGDRAAVVFVVQRDDATSFAPRDRTDPAFGQALREAAAAGVEIRALRCTVTTTSICLGGPIPISLDADTPGSYNLSRDRHLFEPNPEETTPG